MEIEALRKKEIDALRVEIEDILRKRARDIFFGKLAVGMVRCEARLGMAGYAQP